MDQNETFFTRTLSNLAGVWRDVAHSAARSVGLNGRAPVNADPRSLRALMVECLEARGGEVSARMRAAELGETYLEMETAGRRRFLEILAEEFGVDEAALADAIAAYQVASEPDARLNAGTVLRQASIPRRVRLLTQFNALPEGVKFLVDLRADLLALPDKTPALRGLDADLSELLTSWFDIGFLDLDQITWASPAALLEKLIAYEAVHEIRSWTDLRNRVDSDRRLFALFHPRMPDEPLAFVEVALVKGVAGNIQALLDEKAPKADPGEVETATFYSITNTQRGLRGISFGDYLIKRVVQRLTKELPGIKRFATLSPVPGFAAWLADLTVETVRQVVGEAERGGIRALGGHDDPAVALRAVLARPDWPNDPVVRKALREPLLRLGARYMLTRRDSGEPIDPVARFHLKNGARLERINWLGDTSEQGLRQSAGLMVNYRYALDDIEANHEAYMQDGRIAMSAEVRAMTKGLAEAAGRPLRRMGTG
jgi:malonyl-CoA decarboxylase